MARPAPLLHPGRHAYRRPTGALSFLQPVVLLLPPGRDPQGLGGRPGQPRRRIGHHHCHLFLLALRVAPEHALDVRQARRPHRAGGGADPHRQPDEPRDLWPPDRPAVGFPLRQEPLRLASRRRAHLHPALTPDAALRGHLLPPDLRPLHVALLQAGRLEARGAHLRHLHDLHLHRPLLRGVSEELSGRL